MRAGRYKVVRISGIDWNSRGTQAVDHSPFYPRVRLLDYRGTCAGCGRKVFAFRDGGNDLRGPLGDRSYWPIEMEDGREAIACAVCANDYNAYKAIRNGRN